MLLSVNIANLNTNAVDLSSIPSVGLCVSRSVGQSVYPESVLWQNDWVDPDAVWEVSRVGQGWVY